MQTIEKEIVEIVGGVGSVGFHRLFRRGEKQERLISRRNTRKNVAPRKRAHLPEIYESSFPSDFSNEIPACLGVSSGVGLAPVFGGEVSFAGPTSRLDDWRSLVRNE